MRKSTGSKSACAFLLLSACVMVASCRDRGGLKIASPSGKEVSLAITGYNYTNRSINDFSVDGASGGNLHVSSPHSGGGGSVCCSPYVIGAGARRTLIRWQTGACTFQTRRDRSGQLLFWTHYFYREAYVDMNPNVPHEPNIIEAHFYPDGHVEVALTQEASRPRLQLDERRADNSPYPQCPGDERPSQ